MKPGKVRLALWGYLATIGFFYGPIASADGETPQSFVIEGRAYGDAASSIPLLDNIKATIQVLSSDQKCILYEEQQSFDTSNSDGHFSLSVGSSRGSSKRSSNDSNYSMSEVFSNKLTTLNGKNSTDSTACTTTIASGAKRYIRIKLTPSDNVTRTITPDMSMESVPSAFVAQSAESLQGLLPNQFLQANTQTGLTQSALEAIFSGSNYSNLLNILATPAANYVQTGANGTVTVPNISGAPTSNLSQGQIWYDSSTQTIKYYNGTVQTLANGGQGVTQVDSGTGLIGGPITSSGTLSVDVGTTVGKIVQVAAGNKLPSIDGSNLTNVSATSLTGPVSTQSIQIWDKTSTKKITVETQVASSIPNNYTIALPGAPPSATGQVLTSDTSGKMSWINFPTASSVNVTSPIVNTGSATAAQLSLPAASATQDGYLSKTDWSTFNNKVSSLSALAGDVTGTPAATSVDKIKGVAVGFNSLQSGNVLRYNGTNWTNASLKSTDISDLSTIYVSQSNFANAITNANCSTNQSIYWNSVSGAFACRDISGLSATSISNGNLPSGVIISSTNFPSQLANTFLAGPSSGSAVPSFRKLTAADLPTSGATGIFTNGGNSFGAPALLGTMDNYSLQLATGGNPRISMTADGHIGFGTTTPAVPFDFKKTNTQTTNGFSDVGSFQHIASPTSPSAAFYRALSADAFSNSPNMAFSSHLIGASLQASTSSNNIGTLTGSESVGSYVGTGTAARLVGARGQINATGGSITEGIGIHGYLRHTTGSRVQTGSSVYAQVENQAGATTTSTHGVNVFIQNSGQLTNATGLNVTFNNAGSLTNAYGLRMGPIPGSNKWSIYLEDPTAPSYFAGNVGIGTSSPSQKLEVAGSVKATAFISTSDGRLKTNIKTSPGLSLISRLRGVSYNWLSDNKADNGLIAQELEYILPSAVVTDPETGYKAVKYNNLIAPLIESTKELNAKCEINKEQNFQLARRVASIESSLEAQSKEIENLKEENRKLSEKLEMLLKKLQK